MSKSKLSTPECYRCAGTGVVTRYDVCPVCLGSGEGPAEKPAEKEPEEEDGEELNP